MKILSDYLINCFENRNKFSGESKINKIRLDQDILIEIFTSLCSNKIKYYFRIVRGKK